MAQLNAPVSRLVYLGLPLGVLDTLRAMSFTPSGFLMPSRSAVLSLVLRYYFSFPGLAVAYHLLDEAGARSLEVEQSLKKIDRKLMEEARTVVVLIPAQEMDSWEGQLRKLGYGQS
jgi:hypothetical protein